MNKLYSFHLLLLIICILSKFNALSAQRKGQFSDFEKTVKVVSEKVDSLQAQVNQLLIPKTDSISNASVVSWVEIGPQKWTSVNVMIAGNGLIKVNSNEALDTCNMQKKGCYRVLMSNTKKDSTFLYNLYAVQQFDKWGPAEYRLPTKDDVDLLNQYLATWPCNPEGKNSAVLLKDFISWDKAKGSDVFKFGFKQWIPETGRNGFWIKPSDDFETQNYPVEAVWFFDQPDNQELRIFKRTKKGFHFFIRCLAKQ